MVVGSVVKWLGLGLVGAYLFISLADPARAMAASGAIRQGGSLLSTYGGGIRDLFEGIGTGTAKLLNPFWTLRDLIYGPQAGPQAQLDVRQVSSTNPLASTTNILANPNQGGQFFPSPSPTPSPIPPTPPTTGPPSQGGFRYYTDPKIGQTPVANVVVHGQNVPLSQAAISFYQRAGVTVSPQVNQTVSSQNNGNATSASSTSSSVSSSSSSGGSGVSFSSSGHSGSWSGGGFGAAN